MSIPMALPIMGSILEITKLAVSCTSGITPARAGKTAHLEGCTDDSRDHPRSCGKDALVLKMENIPNLEFMIYQMKKNQSLAVPPRIHTLMR